MPIGIRFPFTNTPQGGMFGATQTSAEAVRTNLVSLLTTKRGHRVMNNRLFSPLYDYLFEQWDERAESELDSDLRAKVAEFLPEINVSNITYDFDEQTNTLKVQVIYVIPSLGGIKDTISLTINSDDRI